MTIDMSNSNITHEHATRTRVISALKTFNSDLQCWKKITGLLSRRKPSCDTHISVRKENLLAGGKRGVPKKKKHILYFTLILHRFLKTSTDMER